MIIVTMWNGNVVNVDAGILLGHRQGKDGNCNDVEWQCGERGGWDIVESQSSQVEYDNYNDVEWQCGERGGWDIAGSQTRKGW